MIESEPSAAGAGRSLKFPTTPFSRQLLLLTCSGRPLSPARPGWFRYPVSERECGVGRRHRAGQTDLSSRSRLRRKLRVDERIPSVPGAAVAGCTHDEKQHARQAPRRSLNNRHDDPSNGLFSCIVNQPGCCLECVTSARNRSDQGRGKKEKKRNSVPPWLTHDSSTSNSRCMRLISGR